MKTLVSMLALALAMAFSAPARVSPLPTLSPEGRQAPDPPPLCSAGDYIPFEHFFAV